MLAQEAVTRIDITLDDRSAFGIGALSAADPWQAWATLARESITHQFRRAPPPVHALIDAA